MRIGILFGLAVIVAAPIAGCTADDVNRTVYNSFTRREELHQGPGEARDRPDYDEYVRSRQRSSGASE
jgi:hypothetical protein